MEQGDVMTVTFGGKVHIALFQRCYPNNTIFCHIPALEYEGKPREYGYLVQKNSHGVYIPILGHLLGGGDKMIRSFKEVVPNVFYFSFRDRWILTKSFEKFKIYVKPYQHWSEVYDVSYNHMIHKLEFTLNKDRSAANLLM